MAAPAGTMPSWIAGRAPALMAASPPRRRMATQRQHVAGTSGLGLSLLLIHTYVTSTSPQSSASSRRCGRPGCSAPSGPTSSPPALGRGTRAVRAGPPRRALVCQPHVCCAHWPRLQGRSLLWKTGSWHLNVCYPWVVSWTSGPVCDAHEHTPSLLGGLGDIGTGLDALAGDIEALNILTNALVVSQDHTMALDETVVGCSVSLCSRLLTVYRIANSDGVSLGLMG